MSRGGVVGAGAGVGGAAIAAMAVVQVLGQASGSPGEGIVPAPVWVQFGIVGVIFTVISATMAALYWALAKPRKEFLEALKGQSAAVESMAVSIRDLAGTVKDEGVAMRQEGHEWRIVMRVALETLGRSAELTDEELEAKIIRVRRRLRELG